MKNFLFCEYKGPSTLIQMVCAWMFSLHLVSWLYYYYFCLKDKYLLLSLHADLEIHFSNSVIYKKLYRFTSYSRMDTAYFFKPVRNINV